MSGKGWQQLSDERRKYYCEKIAALTNEAAQNNEPEAGLVLAVAGAVLNVGEPAFRAFAVATKPIMLAVGKGLDLSAKKTGN